jgi:hypothetical protein
MLVRYGLRAFNRGDKLTSQKAMRYRVYAQGFTILAMCAGALYGLKPHDRPANMEVKLDRIHNEPADEDD